MQTVCLQKELYQLNRYTSNQENVSDQAKERYKLIQKWNELKAAGLPEQTIEQILEISRATYYRWKKAFKQKGYQGLEEKSRRPHTIKSSQMNPKTKKLIYKIRKEFVTYGKQKIHVILKREFGVEVSESSVGRALKELMARGVIDKVHYLRKKREPRKFNKHAQRWKYGMKGKRPGELIQIDHMTINDLGRTFKHFKAYDPVSKVMVCEIYGNATSTTAAKFLDKVLSKMPFKVISIQVDGGSEFMKDFEEACEIKNIPLFVLPPRSPKWNGCVERGNRILKDEFYHLYDLPDTIGEIRIMLDDFVDEYNNFRPHGILKGLTPMEYYESNFLEAA